MRTNSNSNANEGTRTLTREQIQQLQQRQRLLLQQRLLEQQRKQQALQNYEAQFYQMLMTLNKRPKRLYNFVEDADSILKNMSNIYTVLNFIFMRIIIRFALLQIAGYNSSKSNPS